MNTSNLLAQKIMTAEEYLKTHPDISPSITPDTIQSQGQPLTTKDIVVGGTQMLITVGVLIAIIYFVLKIIIPKTARYLGYLTWEFGKGRQGKHQ